MHCEKYLVPETTNAAQGCNLISYFPLPPSPSPSDAADYIPVSGISACAFKERRLQSSLHFSKARTCYALKGSSCVRVLPTLLLPSWLPSCVPLTNLRSALAVIYSSPVSCFAFQPPCPAPPFPKLPPCKWHFSGSCPAPPTPIIKSQIIQR